MQDFARRRDQRFSLPDGDFFEVFGLWDKDSDPRGAYSQKYSVGECVPLPKTQVPYLWLACRSHIGSAKNSTLRDVQNCAKKKDWETCEIWPKFFETFSFSETIQHLLCCKTTFKWRMFIKICHMLAITQQACCPIPQSNELFSYRLINDVLKVSWMTQSWLHTYTRRVGLLRAYIFIKYIIGAFAPFALCCATFVSDYMQIMMIMRVTTTRAIAVVMVIDAYCTKNKFVFTCLLIKWCSLITVCSSSSIRAVSTLSFIIRQVTTGRHQCHG